MFVYSENDLIYTYVNEGSTGVYNATENDAVIAVREDGQYRDMISGEIYESRCGKLTLPKKELRAFLLVKLK